MYNKKRLKMHKAGFKYQFSSVVLLLLHYRAAWTIVHTVPKGKFYYCTTAAKNAVSCSPTEGGVEA